MPRIVILAAFMLPCLIPRFADGYTLTERSNEAVVLTGAGLPGLVGADPDSIVAFRFESIGGEMAWIPIPLQVDERAIVDLGRAYGDTLIGITVESYTDTATHVGADPDPTFDAGDELVFLARNAGDRYTGGLSEPPKTIPHSRIDLEITDPLNGDVGYVYLFLSNGSLTQSANQDGVTYDFNLSSGPYKTTYNHYTGPNPENSTVVTPSYRLHFGDRWIRDELNIYAGASTGVDILDRHKNLFAPGNCGRSEDTFSAGEGGFLVNRDGPVRAIRSYLGANSGPLTQREHIFYPDRHLVTTYLRVHAISGVMDFYDYSPDASGMTYYNDLNTAGVTINGIPDTVGAGTITWEMVTGAQGTLFMHQSIITDIPDPSYTSYYSDDSTPTVTQCTGDGYEYGASGFWVDHEIPNTDPLLQQTLYTFTATRLVWFEEPDQPLATAELRDNQLDHPLVVSIIPTAAASTVVPQPALTLHNAPNPFRGSTLITFGAPPGERASVQLFDVTGRIVGTLFDAAVREPLTVISWEGRDGSGNQLPAGIYLCRLKCGRNQTARKLIILE